MSASIDLAHCDETQLWHFVGGHLAKRGIGVVLVGGAVVAVYSDGAYHSGDLDFVEDQPFDERVPEAMAELGFQRVGRHYEHPECRHLIVEFVSGPLGIGRDEAIVPVTQRVGGQELRILSPSDCICDRLASYIHFRARECLDQAVLVAQAQTVDWDRIESWCTAEDSRGPQAFAELRRLSGSA